MSSLCIHGHFYQPPRENPWLGSLPPEGSAAPFLNWNQRIGRECYSPLAWASILDAQGKVMTLCNCYEHISFNFGPTLLSWMQSNIPKTYHKILRADAASRERLGFGNALAQVCHHLIMPLASDEDKKLETAWAIKDFEHRFKRHPEGMWLPETAVDTASLEVLAEHGIAYTILAPRQAAAVSPRDADDWHPVTEAQLDCTQPYRVDLPSGRNISVFFYNGPISQAIAFEELLRNGENFWQRLRGASSQGLLSIATDGESYGHHFTFGEMALAYVLGQAEKSHDIQLTNYAAYLAAHPPLNRVRIHENSSWSCAHGIERWRSDCGCNTGGHSSWNQKWRTPLRHALDNLRTGIRQHFERSAPRYFQNPDNAVQDFEPVALCSADADEFAYHHLRTELSETERTEAWSLLSMQLWSLSSLASCSWFFDDIDRIEPLNAMSYATRALELAECTGADANALKEAFLHELEPAIPNSGRAATGRQLYDRFITPRRISPMRSLCLSLYRLHVQNCLPSPGNRTELHWPLLTAAITCTEHSGSQAKGRAELTLLFGERHQLNWQWDAPGAPDFGRCSLCSETGEILESCTLQELSWGQKQALALEGIEISAAQHWAQETTQARKLLPLLQPMTEGQTQENLRYLWAQIWAALGWEYCRQEQIPQEIGKIVAGLGPGEDEKQRFSHQVERGMLGLLELSPTDADGALWLLLRARELFPEIDCWRLRNRVWDLGVQKPELRELALALGFAPDALGN